VGGRKLARALGQGEMKGFSQEKRAVVYTRIPEKTHRAGFLFSELCSSSD
jgi:hypothetical protein